MTRRMLAYLLIFSVLLSGCQAIAGDPPRAQSAPGPVDALRQTDAAGMPDPRTIGLDETLPIDPNVRKAVLDNGLTYYVRRNTEPANRAELMLAVNAGSVQEDADQLGLAHFLEHMMFNGTERFPEQSLIEFFETIGMSFGPDVNAYTSFDETVYFLRIPTDDPEIVETAFQVLEDWAGYATIADAEVETERGIILEEERLRDQNANGRLRKQILPFLLGDSRYTERQPIGDMDIIRNAPPEALRRFYRDWYRPDLMAVIAVGDFDPAAIEQKIIEHFGDLPQPEDPRPRPDFSVPDHAETRYLLVTDPEFPVTIAEISFKQPFEKLETVAAYKNLLIGRLFRSMLNFRLDEISRQADSPFLGASVGEGGLVRDVTTLSVSAQVREGEVLSGLEAALTEVERVRRHGFTQTELDRAKSETLNFYQRLFNDRENLESDSFANEYVRNFLENEAIPGIAFEYLLSGRLVPEITLEEVNRQADRYVGLDNRTVLVIGPEREADSLPSEAELATVIEAVQAKQIDPYEDTEVVDALLTDIPAPAQILSQETNEAFGIVDLTLENGVRVLLKQTDFKEEEVLFVATSPGGSSLVSDEDYPEAALIGGIVGQSGVDDVSYAELLRFLADQSVTVRPRISELEEGFAGGAGKDFLPALFQLIYLYGTAPQADEDAFATLKDQATAFLRNRELQPDAAFQDALTAARYGDTIRQGVLPLEAFETLDLDRALAIYQDRFADFSDFTFIFVGNFDVAQMIEWSQIYLGNLPATGRTETWRDVSPDPPEGVVEVPVYRGQEQQSITRLLFTGPAEQSQQNRLRLRMLEGILDILMREELREERAGVYASGVSASMQPEPDQLYEVSLAFGSDPERADELVDALFGLIEQLQTDGPRADLLEKAKAQVLRQREEQLEQNRFWLDVLELYATGEASGEEVDLAQLLDLEGRVQAVTVEEIQAAAVEFLPLDRYILVTLLPEGFDDSQE